MTNPAEQVIVITGSSTGIGAATAIEFAKRGFSVVAGVRTKADQERLKTQGTDAILLDVTKIDHIQKAVSHVEKTYPDAKSVSLVNNAGIVRAGPWELVPADHLRTQFEVNVFGLVDTTREFLPLIRKTKGRIVNISSISGRIGSAFLGPYCASKAAVESITDSMRNELRPFGVEVVSVNPGPIDTPIWTKKTDTQKAVTDGLKNPETGIYSDGFSQFVATFEKAEKNAEPVSKVVEAIDTALHAPNPQTRYYVGKGIRFAASLSSHLPDRTLDWVLSKMN